MEPTRDERGVPYCSSDDCREYDGKRCRLMGFRPSGVCEPAVVELLSELTLLRKQVATW